MCARVIQECFHGGNGVRLNTGAQILDEERSEAARRGLGDVQDPAEAGRTVRRTASEPGVVPGWADQASWAT